MKKTFDRKKQFQEFYKQRTVPAYSSESLYNSKSISARCKVLCNLLLYKKLTKRFFLVSS